MLCGTGLSDLPQPPEGKKSLSVLVRGHKLRQHLRRPFALTSGPTSRSEQQEVEVKAELSTVWLRSESIP